MTNELVSSMEAEAHRLGFSGFGVADPSASLHLSQYQEWLRKGFHGDMAYLAREDSLSRRADLTLTMEEVRSVVVVAQEYFQPDSPGVPEDPARGVIARYARGADYHDIVKGRLQELLAWGRTEVSRRGMAKDLRGFAYVDTGPILERDLARRAGLGWFGKNTMLIHPRRGSYFFLGLLLLDLELPLADPFQNDRCGSCRRCLDACPTGALLGRNQDGAPVMDTRRCISYLTIENKGPIPREFRRAMGNRIFGCDICQEVCPWNRKFAEVSEEPAYAAGLDTDGPALVELMGLTEDEFAPRFSGSPVKRAKRRGLLRNVAVALGNWLDSVEEAPAEAVSVLVEGLSDSESLVRGHAAWALGRVASPAVVSVLGGRMEIEEDPSVRAELDWALGCWRPS